MDADIQKRLDKMRVLMEAKEAEQHKQIADDPRHEIIENTVTKSNALARANYRFDIVEKRIMEALVSKLDSRVLNERGLQDVEIRAVEYAKTFDVPVNIAYRDLAKATARLVRTVITVREEKGNHEYNLMSDAYYKESEGAISCCFSPKIAPHLIGLRKQFASYPLAQAVDFKSSYTWRLFEIMVSWAQDKKQTGGILTGWFTLSVEDLRQQLGMPDTYQWVHISDTLDKATKELQEKARIHTKIERIKTSRKITHLRFEFIEDLQQDLLT